MQVLYSIQDLLDQKSYNNTNLINSRLKSLKQGYNIVAYIWVNYGWFKNSLLFCVIFTSVRKQVHEKNGIIEVCKILIRYGSENNFVRPLK